MRYRFLSLLLTVLCLSALAIPAIADGILLPVERPNTSILVPDRLFTVKYHHVDVTIDNQVCTTKVDQIFHNDTSVEREGMYVFPMPEGSAITKFSMFAGESEIQGKILDKGEARQIYESIVRQRKDPAILEYIDRNTFRARVYPIPANGDKRIRLTYCETAQKSGDVYRYVYPLSTERFSAKPLEDCKVRIKIKSKRPITSVYSPTHSIEVERPQDNEAVVSWQVKNTKPDTDMVLYYAVSSDDIGIDLIAHRENGDKGYYMLLASPRATLDKSKIQPKNVVFVLDRTGSMAGEKIDQAKSALKFCLNSLRDQDRFNVITFNESPDLLYDKMQKLSAEARKKALGSVDEIDATGGTNINEALSKALTQFPEPGANNYVVFLTDGLPTAGETDVNKILDNAKTKNNKKAKIFSFGVGYDVNTHFLDKLSGNNRGSCDYVRPNENIETKVSAFFAKVSDPILADVNIDISGVKTSDAFPSGDIPDIFKGTQLVVFGRYTGSGKVKVKLSGVTNGSKKAFTLDADLPQNEPSNQFMPQLWASRKIGYLLDEIRLHNNKELINEVIRLSKEYGIPTEFTSFLADDRELVQDVKRAGDLAKRKVGAANEVQTGSYGVSQSANAQVMRNQAQMPPADAVAMPGVRMEGKVAANARIGGMYYDSNDKPVVVANVQNVAGRTFYQRGDYWEDNNIKDNQQFVKIKQFSDAHFKLLKAYPKLSQYSTLGNVRLTLENNQAVEIGPEGKETLSDSEMKSLMQGNPVKSGSTRQS